MAETPYYLARPGAPSAKPTVVIDGVTYTPVPGQPGVYVSPWGQYGYIGSEAGTDQFGNPTSVQTFSPIPDRYLKNLGLDDGSDGSGTRLASDDPRYWDLQYQKLAQDYMNMGLDADAARQQALATLITNRNNLAADIASTEANVAKTAADYAANPRDAFAELYYRNQVGGATPFGDLSNENFGEYGKALAEKASTIFSPYRQAIAKAGEYRDAIPQPEFFGAETRSQLGLPPTPAQSLLGPTTSATSAPATGGNDVGGALQFIAALNSDPQKKADFLKWVTAANGGVQPTTAEDGVNMNIMEPAAMVGRSGRVYFTVAEKDPEEVIVKKLPSTKEREKREKQMEQSFMKATQGATRMAEGGSATVTPDDLMEQLSQYLGSLGGSGRGTGAFDTPLPSPRLLAGDPWNFLQDDPVAMDYALSGYSALGIDPRTVQSTVKKFTPNNMINNFPRVSFA